MNGIRGLRAGVIGPRGIGRVHIESVRRVGVEVVAVASSSHASAQEMADVLGVPRACESYQDLVALQDVDVVHVCTPPGAHVDQVLAALEAGKHVISEKPLATSAADAERLLEAAQAKDVVHAVTYNYRFYPMVQALRLAVADGKLGDVHLIQGNYLLNELLALGDDDHWLLHPDLAGPGLVLADVGVHWWDMIEHVTGRRVTEVMCTSRVVRKRGGEGADSAGLMLRLDGGTVAVAAISDVAAGYGNAIEVLLVGTEASATWRQQDPERLWISPLEGPIELTVRPQQPAGVHLPPTLQLPAEQPQGYLDAFRDMVATIYGSVADRSAEVTYPTFADAARGVRVLEALNESASEGRWVPVP